MDNSLNSSSPEPTVSNVKSIFKKPANVTTAFEVSIDESITGVPNNRSELDLDITTSGSNKVLPFKKSTKTVQNDFNISSENSTLSSEAEQSVTFAKPLPVFSRKRKSLVDFFNVSYNESNSHLENTERSIEESNIFNKNPFKKSNQAVGSNESIMHEVTKNGVNFDESQRAELSSVGEADSTTFVSKENPFRKDNQSLQLELTTAEADKAAEDDSQTVTNSRIDDEPDSDVLTKSNPFKHKKSLESNNSATVTKQRSSFNTPENTAFAVLNNTSKNISLDRSISKATNKSTSYLEQSSFNDENLNDWMSDQSDEEIPPPTVPTPTANISHSKEQPAIPNPPVTETYQPIDWEQQFKEIIDNAEKKSKEANIMVDSRSKPKPKKSNLNVDKPGENVKKYKPPKLVKPASFANKKFYNYIIKKLEPKYGIDAVLESENLVTSICDTVKKVTRRKKFQKSLIQSLKKEMAEAGLIETTMDFYEFVIKFLPYEFRLKVVPCLQPVSNIVYPPKDSLNPFDKIL